jgi:predicted DNA-binding helix-hairpin-helix protein
MSRHVSLTTQFVVGAAQEQDRELLRTTSWLYRKLRLARVYYSAFNPVSDTPLEGHPATPGWREHRLYQADFLLRQYAYTFEELVFDDAGDLPREADPKLMWSRMHPEFYPVELNRARKADLLRVPGVGPVLAERILQRRRHGKLREMADTGLPRAAWQRAAPHILLNGQRPIHQLSLW